MVGYYFERRRALATGIACCGSGIGAFMFAPLCNFLLEEYDWKGATWILSGLVLHGFLFSVFYRPLGHAKAGPEDRVKVVENGESSEQKEALLAERKEEEGEEEEEEESKGRATALSTSAGDHADSTVVQTPSVAFVTEGDNVSVLTPTRVTTPTIVVPDVTVETEEKMFDALLKNAEGVYSAETELMEKNGNALPRISDLIQTVTPEVHRVESVESKTFMSDFHLKPTNPTARMAFSQDLVGPNNVKKRHPHASQRFIHHNRQHHHSYNYLEIDNPLLRKDIFYSGSLRHIAEFQSSENMAEYRQKVTMPEDMMREGGSETAEGEGDEESVISRRRSFFKRIVVDPLRHVFDVSLLRSPTFVIYGFSCLLSMLGECHDFSPHIFSFFLFRAVVRMLKPKT